MRLIKANAIEYPVRTDSDVFQAGAGYERMLIVTGWNPESPNHLGRVHIRVDQNPSDSFATFSAWTPNSGWQTLVKFAPADFWEDMPGYLRWANDATDNRTVRLAGDLITEVVDLLDA